MDEIILNTIKDGDSTQILLSEAPSKVEIVKQKFEGTLKKKRRRGKYKRKITKPFSKVPWQDIGKKDKPKRNNKRYRKIILSKTQAPFNNNQFLMEIHKPEPENNFNIIQTPSARTRDSSFSIDSEDNYYYSLPEDEEEYLTKEFSSVYEDAQTERLTNMSKDELIQEYLLLEAKYENLVKRTERSKAKVMEMECSDKETSVTDKDSTVTDRNTSGMSVESSAAEDRYYTELLQRIKEQEEQLHELELTNEKLRLENEHLHQRTQQSSSEDSESDSSSTSDSDSSTSSSVVNVPNAEESNVINDVSNEIHANDQIEETEKSVSVTTLVNGFHGPNE